MDLRDELPPKPHGLRRTLRQPEAEPPQELCLAFCNRLTVLVNLLCTALLRKQASKGLSPGHWFREAGSKNRQALYNRHVKRHSSAALFEQGTLPTQSKTGGGDTKLFYAGHRNVLPPTPHHNCFGERLAKLQTTAPRALNIVRSPREI